MIECPSCAAAAENPRTGRYHAGCVECQARALAQGPDFHAATMLMKMTPAYTAALRKVFGTAHSDVHAGHMRVRAWAERIQDTSDKVSERSHTSDVSERSHTSYVSEH